jgi:hypothetical protein
MLERPGYGFRVLYPHAAKAPPELLKSKATLERLRQWSAPAGG